MYRFLIIALFVCGVLSCTKPTDTPPVIQTLPYKVGQTNEYSLKTEVYRVNDEPVVSEKQLKEVVVKEEVAANKRIFTIERYARATSADEWKITEVLTAQLSANELIQTEQSLPYLKVVFPVIEESRWNATKYQNTAEQTATTKAVNKPYGAYPQTFTIEYANDSTLIDLRKSYEIYSPSEGLIYKEQTNLNYCQSSPDCIGKGIISYGTRSIWKRKVY